MLKVSSKDGKVGVRDGKLIICETCGCGCNCTNSDVVFLIDTTGSMDPTIAAIADAIESIATELSGGDCRFAVAEFKDFNPGFSGFGFSVPQQFTTDIAAVVAAVNGLTAGLGDDEPEAHLLALEIAATAWTSAFGADPEADAGRCRHVILFSDAPPHHDETVLYPPPPGPQDYPPCTDIANLLLSQCVHVTGVDTPTPARTLDLYSGGCMESVIETTGGLKLFLSGEANVSEIAESICRAASRCPECTAEDPPCCGGYLADLYCVSMAWSLFTEYFLIGSEPDTIDYNGGIESGSWGGIVTFGVSCVDGVWTVGASDTSSGTGYEWTLTSFEISCFPFQFTAVFTVPMDHINHPGETVTLTVAADVNCEGMDTMPAPGGGDTLFAGPRPDVTFSGDRPRRVRGFGVPAPASLAGMLGYIIRVRKCSNGRWCWAVTERGRTVARGDEESEDLAWVEARSYLPGGGNP